LHVQLRRVGEGGNIQGITVIHRGHYHAPMWHAYTHTRARTFSFPDWIRLNVSLLSLSNAVGDVFTHSNSEGRCSFTFRGVSQNTSTAGGCTTHIHSTAYPHMCDRQDATSRCLMRRQLFVSTVMDYFCKRGSSC
jgi:hypothetical protein